MITILLFPVIVFLWLVGWSLCWIGDERQSQRIERDSDDGVSIAAGLYEEVVSTSRK